MGRCRIVSLLANFEQFSPPYSIPPYSSRASARIFPFQTFRERRRVEDDEPNEMMIRVEPTRGRLLTPLPRKSSGVKFRLQRSRASPLNGWLTQFYNKILFHHLKKSKNYFLKSLYFTDINCKYRALNVIPIRSRKMSWSHNFSTFDISLSIYEDS